MKELLAMAVGVLCMGNLCAADFASRIVDEGKLDSHRAQSGHAETAQPEYPAAYRDTGGDVCIALGYSVKSDGSTGDFRVLRAWSSDNRLAETDDRYLDTFAAAAGKAVAQWRYQPDVTDGSPLYTVATLEFEGTGATRRLEDRCRITQLANHYRAIGRNPLRSLDVSRDMSSVALYGVQRHAGILSGPANAPARRD